MEEITIKNEVIKSLLQSLPIQVDGEEEKMAEELVYQQSLNKLEQNVISSPKNTVFLRALQIKLEQK